MENLAYCDRVLGVFAKKPELGKAKTRLAQATSSEWAQRVAVAFLEDSLDRFSQVQAARVIVYAPAAEAGYFAALGEGRFGLTPQSEGDLGQRLQAFFGAMRRQGRALIIAVGADSPTLPGEYVEQAFALLADNDVVIGPALDGGYYLIGAGIRDVELFAEIPWSTPRVLEATVARLRAQSARLALLPPWYDVDTATDWALLRGHVLAQRQAGLDPGVPRVERLIAEESGAAE